MAYLSNFESDVFISYAHYDNDQLLHEPRGWVEQLHSDLEKRVKVHLGAQPSLWRDQEIRNNQEFESVILSRLVKTATFLAVISPSFVKREWCIREVEEFVATAAKTFGVRLDSDKVRIFKVEKIRVDPNVLPHPLKGTGAYRFYAEHEFRPVIGGENFRRYYETMDELARDIADVLVSLSQRALSAAGASSNVEVNDAPPITVYLAETTSDLAEQADEVRGTLKSRGCNILPSGDLSDGLDELKTEVRDALSRSSLSVHLIGRNYGPIVDGAYEKSKAWIQHDLAMERGKDPTFARLVWVANENSPSDVRQLNFLSYLRDDPSVQARTEFLQKKNLSELKRILENQIDRIKAVRSESRQKANDVQSVLTSSRSQTNSLRRIYLICESSDQVSPPFVAMRNFLFNLGYEPVLPSENTNEQEALQEHNDNLAICDAHLIYYGEGSERWLNAKLMDFRKVLSRRLDTVLAKAIYIAPPALPGKENFNTHEALVLRGGESFSSDDLAPFLEALRSKPPASA